MASKAFRISFVVLRILTLLLLAGSIVLFVINTFTLSDGTKTTFKDVIAYRYVVITAALGFLYTLLQIPFAIYYLWKEKRLIRNGCMPEFDFYGDKIFAFLLATGVGAGFAVSFEFKKLLRDFIDSLEALGVPEVDESKTKGEKFLDKGIIATGVLFLAFLCMAVLSFLSSIHRATTTTTSTRGFLFG